MKFNKNLFGVLLGFSLCLFSCKEDEDSLSPPSITFTPYSTEVEVNKIKEDLTEVILLRKTGAISWDFEVKTSVGLNEFIFEGVGEVPYTFVFRDTLEIYNFDLTSFLLSSNTFDISLTAIDNLDQVTTHNVILINPED